MNDMQIIVRKEDVDLAEKVSRDYPACQTQVFTAVLSTILMRRFGAINDADHPKVGDAPKITKPLTITEFFARLRPSQDVSKVLGAACFLEKHTGVTEFTADEIKACILQGKIKLPANVSLAILRNAQKGLMAEAGKREGGKKTWMLTQTGGEAVEQLLSAKEDRTKT